MASPVRRRTPVKTGFLTDEFLPWIAGGVLGYSSVVLLLALDSMALAESVLRFQTLNQFAIVALVLLGTIGIFCRTVVSGWKHSYSVTILALVLLLPGVQPSEDCCDELVAFIAGYPSSAPPVLSSVLCHALPMVGCGLLIGAEIQGRSGVVTAGRRRS